MKYNAFGRLGTKVSRLGYGAMGLGGVFGQHDEKDLVSSVLNSLEKGVNFIDTARNYGKSERILGQALREWKGEKPFIACKIQSKNEHGWSRPNLVDS
jgi:methylglyoxal reductase